ncbi:mechanosensitive ion channel family protein [Weeksellaceae bacterium TAE3-ERU29]|nr:mechanosensitive ion channel family protein [Weeksellaceae bacterium TAE3-ERU29]
MLFLQIKQETKEAVGIVEQSVSLHYEKLLLMLPRIVIGILIIILGLLISKIITNVYKKRFMRKSTDPLMASFLSKSVRLFFLVISTMLALEVAGLSSVAGGILAAAGGFAIIAGFAFQDIGKNFLAGIILAFNRPFNINDSIKVDAHFGKVKALNFRYTHIKTIDGRDIFIPNSDVLTKPVENYTRDGFYRLDFIVGIGYENDIQAAKELIMKILASNTNIIEDASHKNFVIEDELGTSTVNLKVFFWVDTKDYKVASNILRGNIIREVKEALTKGNFNMPADIKELKIYGTEKDIPIRLTKE